MTLKAALNLIENKKGKGWRLHAISLLKHNHADIVFKIIKEC